MDRKIKFTMNKNQIQNQSEKIVNEKKYLNNTIETCSYILKNILKINQGQGK